MGSFFTNVQVHAGLHPAGDVHAAIVAAIRQLALAESLLEVDPAARDAERLIAIGPAGTPWITIYDSATETQDAATLDALARALSQAVNGAAVSIAVHDSDVLAMRLWRAGEQVDAYSSYPDYFGHVSRAERRALAGKPDRWLDLLREGATPADLRAVCDEPLLFAEATLARTAELLDMDITACGSGLRYQLCDGPDGPGVAPDSGFLLLAFRPAEPAPQAEPQPLADEAPLSDLPVLTVESGSGGIACEVGSTLSWAECAAGNAGAAGQGLDIVVWGSALDAGLVTIDAVEVSKPPADDSVETQWARHTPEVLPAGAGVAQVVRLDGYQLLGATAGWGDAFSSASWRDPHAAIRAQTARHIHVRLHGVAASTGTGQLHVGFVPHENTRDGQTAFTMPVEVTRRARRPLRFTAESPGAEQHLRALDDPRLLVGLVALGADRARCAEVAADAITAWHAAIAPRGGRYEGFVHERFDHRPRPFRMPTQAIPGGAPWQAVRDALAQAVSVSASLRRARSHSHDGHTAGFHFSADSLFLQYSGDTAAPHLLLWWDTEGHDAETVRTRAAALAALVDQAMAAGGGLQAFVARWSWAGLSLGSADCTPYELACGVHGQCTASRAWCGRWLRGVAEQLWLGPDLMAQLGDAAALDAIAEVRVHGGGVRAELRPDATLDALERALAPVLPGEEDWRRGIDQIYRRAAAPPGELPG